MNQGDFEKRFPRDSKGRYRATEPTFTIKNAQSRSQLERAAMGLWPTAGQRVKPPKVNILWKTWVTNGRDLEKLSANPHEREVATLPGAQFKITSMEMDAKPGAIPVFTIKAKQIK